MFTVGNTIITTDESVKHIGVHLDRHPDFNKQIKELCRKAACQLNVLQRLARHLDQEGGTNGHFQDFHHVPLQLLPPGVAFLWCYKHVATPVRIYTHTEFTIEIWGITSTRCSRASGCWQPFHQLVYQSEGNWSLIKVLHCFSRDLKVTIARPSST